MTYDLIIVGTGHGGCTVAREFRRRRPDATMLLLTADDGRVYSKPMLSTAFDRGQTVEALATQQPEAFAAAIKAEVLTRTRVLFINTADRLLDTTGGPFRYQSLVLAIGATPRELPIEGDAADTIYRINSLEDYDRYREAVEPAGHVTVVGAGLVGCEFANDLATSGREVTLLDPMAWPLKRFVPQDVGGALAAALTTRGVDVRMGTTAASIDREEGRYRLSLSDGSMLTTDLVVAAIGLDAKTGLAADAGIETGHAITVDRRLATSVESVYALGDCAAVDGMHLPFIMPIMRSARVLAAALCGEPDVLSYAAMPITVKTPCLPIVVSPPLPGAEGNWHLEHTDKGIRGRFLDEAGNMLGFVVTGSLISENRALAADLPPWLS